jgi:hypothetical protein
MSIEAMMKLPARDSGPEFWVKVSEVQALLRGEISLNKVHLLTAGRIAHEWRQRDLSMGMQNALSGGQ